MFNASCLLLAFLFTFRFCTATNISHLENVDKNHDPFTIPVPSAFNTSTHSTIVTYPNSLDSRLTVLADGNPKCDGVKFGFGLDVLSCFDAWAKIGSDRKRLLWGQRGATIDYTMKLPFRWSSGRCIGYGKIHQEDAKLACNQKST